MTMRDERPTLASAMYPGLPADRRAVEQRQRASADQRLWAQILKKQRDDFVQKRREANAAVDARLKRK
jgi:hypothetical protein